METATPPAAPMQKAIVPPSNTADTSSAKTHEQAREARIKAAMAPKPDAAKSVDTKAAETVAKPADQKPAETKPVSIIAKPDAKPVEAAPVADPVESMKLPPNASEESVVRFADLAKVAKERKTAVDTLQKKIAELEARPATSSAPNAAEQAEVERLRSEHKAATDKLAIYDIQNHPDFNRQYVEPKKKALATASEVIAYNEKSVPEMGALLTKPLKDFNATVSELTKDMNSADAAAVAQSLRQARDLHAQEQQALSSSSELRTQLQAKTQLEQKKAFEAVASEVVPNFIKREVTDTMSAEEKASAVEYNRSVDGLRAKAETRAFGKVSERDVATMAFKEAALDHLVTHAVPFLERHVASQNDTIASLTAELQKMRGGNSPSVSSSNNAGAAKTDVSKMTREERTHYYLHGAGRPGAQQA